MTPRQIMDGENVRSPILKKLLKIAAKTSRLMKNIGGCTNDFECNCISIGNQNYSSDTSLGYYNAYTQKHTLSVPNF